MGKSRFTEEDKILACSPRVRPRKSKLHIGKSRETVEEIEEKVVSIGSGKRRRHFEDEKISIRCGGKSTSLGFDADEVAMQALTVNPRENTNRCKRGKRKEKNNSQHNKTIQSSYTQNQPSEYTFGDDDLGGLLDTSSCDSDNSTHFSRRKYHPVNNFGGSLKSGECHYRSNMQTAVKELDMIQFRESHFQVLHKMPFWFLLKGLLETDYEELLESTKKNEEVIREILERFDIKRQFFYVGDETLELTRRDVQLIFGICDGNKVIPMKGHGFEKPRWLLRCFKQSMKQLTKIDLINKLKEIVKSKSECDVMDVARLTHCYLLACVLTPNKCSAIPWYLASFVDDLYNACSYDWSSYIVNVLVNSMVTTTNKHVGGAAIILPYWLCEHTTIVPPVYPDKFPRYLRWNLTDLYKKVRRLAICDITRVQVKSVDLKPTRKEKISLQSLLKLRAGGSSFEEKFGRGESRTISNEAAFTSEGPSNPVLDRDDEKIENYENVAPFDDVDVSVDERTEVNATVGTGKNIEQNTKLGDDCAEVILRDESVNQKQVVLYEELNQVIDDEICKNDDRTVGIVKNLEQSTILGDDCAEVLLKDESEKQKQVLVHIN